MKSKKMKTIIVIVLVILLSINNFIFLGINLISYAADNVATNHDNVEFDVYFKNQEEEKITDIDTLYSSEDIYAYIYINVLEEGYFDGKITLEDTKLRFKEKEDEIIKTMTDSSITLNQLNSGSRLELEIELEVDTKNDMYDIRLLDSKTNVVLNGIYRDSSEKDIEIEAERKIKVNLIENNSSSDMSNVKNDIEIITNKVMEVENEKKRVVQAKINLGLIENNYPMKSLNVKISVPEIDSKDPEVHVVVNMNNMSVSNYEYDEREDLCTIDFKNELNEEGLVNWKKDGQEEIILTLVYDEEIDSNNQEISVAQNLTLYNENKLENSMKIVIDEEKDATLEVENEFLESVIYKGKIYSNIERNLESKTTVLVNYADVIKDIVVEENSTKYVVNEEENNANVVFNVTKINKESMLELLGEDARIKIYDVDGNEIQYITENTQADDEGNIVIEYSKEESYLKFVMSKPITEGELELLHIKTIKDFDEDVEKNAENLKSEVVIKNYNELDLDEEELVDLKNTIAIIESTSESIVDLEESITNVIFEVDKKELSTVVGNNVEMKVILQSNNEKYDLYKNPQIIITMPQDVTRVNIDSIDLMYEEELNIKDYEINGREITINLEGEQTEYKEDAILGTVVIIDATLVVDSKAISKDEEIVVRYENEKSNRYDEEKSLFGEQKTIVEIVAPTDLTVVTSVNDFNIDVIGKQDNLKVNMPKGAEAKQTEVEFQIMNNNSEKVNNVRILGSFATNNSINNVDISIIEAVTLSGNENVEIYYTENENVTDDVNDSLNGWTKSLENGLKVKNYLVVIESMEAKTSITGSYVMEIPEKLEYNEYAKFGYIVKYIDSVSNVESVVESTYIELDSGVGPKLETSISSFVRGKEIENSVVRNGEVIKYIVKLENIGSEDVTGVKVIGDVPNGTTLLGVYDDYEYLGEEYYKELSDTTYEVVIESLKIGETKYIEYEVVVDDDTVSNIQIINKSQVEYGEVKTEADENILNVQNGKIKTVVKRVTDRRIPLVENGTVQYYVVVENISGNVQENVVVNSQYSEGLEVEKIIKMSDIDSEKVIKENIEFSDNLNIGSLAADETIILSIYFKINDIADDNSEIEFSVITNVNDVLYNSNVWKDIVDQFDISLSMTTTANKYVKSGDVIEYIITLENLKNVNIQGMQIHDKIPEQLTIKNITVNGEQKNVDGNNIWLYIDVNPNERVTIKIDTIVNYSETRYESETITNMATASIYGEEKAKTEGIVNIIEADKVLDDSEEENNNNDQENSGSTTNGDRLITGTAWEDENGNGIKETNENTLSDIVVKIVDVETNEFVVNKNGDILKDTTDDKGVYVLENIPTGEYIIVFEYDEKYGLTKYEVEGATEVQNSNVMINEILIGTNNLSLPSTDIVYVGDENISDINIGLIILKNFDLGLNKYVSKIIVQNDKETKQIEYNNVTMAKVEIDDDYANGSTVIIEYIVEIINNGEIDGYVKKIVDYIPKGLEFSSELNKTWYQSDGVLYNTSMANDKIGAGESYEIKLILTKTMTENNMGLVNNTAEIENAYNELGIKDSNSTPGNRVKGENDMGMADTIIGISTGGYVYITIGTIIAMLLLGTTLVVIVIKNKEKNKNINKIEKHIV